MNRLWDLGEDVAWAVAGVGVVGFLLTRWARLHLGRLWSGAVARKEGHRLIDSGPYGIVRHPMYTGLLAAAVATEVVNAPAAAFLGIGFVGTGLWLKAAIEERFLAAELGPNGYGEYRRRVPMLIPWGPTAKGRHGDSGHR